MVIDTQTIKYTKTDVRVVHYDTGISDWEGIADVYRGQSIRNKVICRFDAAKFLNMYFSEETIRVYRPVLLMLAKAQVTDPTKFSGAIKDFIKMDSVFADKIHYMYHSCPEDVSFGVHVIQCLANVFVNTESRYRTFFRNRPEVVICISDGWLYYSFEDAKDGPLLPDKIECEVLSYAKNWNGNFRYREI